MSSAVIHEARRRLTERQAEVVARLVEAAVEEIEAAGYQGLTVRNVARRAGVAPATAYTYFSSKDHLVAETAWRRMHDLPAGPTDAGGSAADRVTAALRDMGLFTADAPELSAACTTALLGGGPDVKHLRDRIGAEMHLRLQRALGDEADPAILRALELALTGAMLTAGMGHMPFDEIPERLAEVVHLILGGSASRSGAAGHVARPAHRSAVRALDAPAKRTVAP
jgi:AcrR family transcriptional regulator